MNKLIREIGTVVLATIIIAIPVLTACSFMFGWFDFIKMVFVLLTMAEWVAAYNLIWKKGGE